MVNNLNDAKEHTALPGKIEKIREILAEVMDPEVPVLSVLDLGIVRDIKGEIKSNGGESWTIIITPTYTGCPAMDTISINIRLAMIAHGFNNVNVEMVLSPAWTTDWMSESGKMKLKEYGIAPPNPKQQVCRNDLFAPDEAVQCPRCNSYRTERISEFGSTACKALFQCRDCNEPFDYFKCH